MLHPHEIRSAKLPTSADFLACYIGSRHAWISEDHARDMIRADMAITRPHVPGCDDSGLALRSAIRVARRLFPDDDTIAEVPCSKSSELS